MKRTVLLSVLVFVGVAGWRIGDVLSPDALGIVVGLLLGILASVPTALMVMAAGRSHRGREAEPKEKPQALPATGGYGGYGPPPVIVLTQGGMAPAGYGQGPDPSRMLPGGGQGQTLEANPRSFKVVGEQEAWLDEF